MKWRIDANILAVSTRYSLSFPQRETIRGKSWLFQNNEFHPSPLRDVCHLLIVSLNLMKSNSVGRHFPSWGCQSIEACSNWKTIDNSLRFGSEYNFAISGVAPHVSPTVKTSYLPNDSRFISCKNGCNCGPLPVILLSTSFPIKSITSIRNPPIPFSSQKFIILWTSSRTFGFSQFKSGWRLLNKWK